MSTRFLPSRFGVLNLRKRDIVYASCFLEPKYHTNSPLLFELSYIAIILFDTLLFLLALLRMGAMRRLSKESFNPRTSLVSILLRDGESTTVFFPSSIIHIRLSLSDPRYRLVCVCCYYFPRTWKRSNSVAQCTDDQ